ILVYNLNRRFGPARKLIIPSYRPSTEYISSMASLYKKAGAGDVAVETIYKGFLRDFARKTDTQMDPGPEVMAEIGQRRFGWDELRFRALMARCQAIANGERITEPEMLKLAAQLEDYRRKADLARLP